MKDNTPITLEEIEYQNSKLNLVSKVRAVLKSISDDLTSDFNQVPDGTPGSQTFEACYQMALYIFFAPFVEFLDEAYDQYIIKNDSDGNFNFYRTKKRIIDLSLFIIQMLEQSSNIFEETIIKSQDYRGLMDRFNQEIVKDFVLRESALQ